jgi:hypothetical protein
MQAAVAKVGNGAYIVAPLMIPVLTPVEVKIVYIEIRDAGNNQLISVIELLLPVNKRDPGLQPYLEKRRRLLTAGVHLMEIDLLRRGARVYNRPRLPASHYLVTLTRAPAKMTETWPLQLQDRLPRLPVPLLPPDEDATFDLQAALAEVYEDAAYDLSIDYQEPPPPPPLATDDLAWIHGLIGQRPGGTP